MSFFETWAKRVKFNKNGPIPPDEYKYCFYMALARMAVVLNRGWPNSPFPRSLLQKDDEVIYAYFDNNDLWRFARIIGAELASDLQSRAIEKEDIAEHFFYGWFEIERDSDGLLPIHYYLPEGFFRFNYEGFHYPQRSETRTYTYREINPKEVDDDIFLPRCAANYLLRNFWHNYVHNELHGIRRDNYREFRGAARHESDFEADNLSHLLLCKSYGLPVLADSVESTTPEESIRGLLRRNRCNHMFQLRAEARSETDEGDMQRFEEAEWRERRRLSGYISGWLVAQGLAVSNLAVYYTGDIKERRGKLYRQHPGIVVVVNGMRLVIERFPPAPGSSPEEIHEYLRNTANVVQSRYTGRLQRDERKRAFAKRCVNNVFYRLGLHRQKTARVGAA